MQAEPCKYHHQIAPILEHIWREERQEEPEVWQADKHRQDDPIADHQLPLVLLCAEILGVGAEPLGKDSLTVGYNGGEVDRTDAAND